MKLRSKAAQLGVLLASLSLYASLHTSAKATDYYASSQGTASNSGTVNAPWDLSSSLKGDRPIKPGDTLFLRGGTYKAPRSQPYASSFGYAVALSGDARHPIRIRSYRNEHVIIDGGLAVGYSKPCNYIWIEGLDIRVSEPRPTDANDPFPWVGDYSNITWPWGGLNALSGRGCKFINLVIHDNAQGVSWWKPMVDSELYGCIIYDNGWIATNRGHGHGVYTQNDGPDYKTIKDCIFVDGYSGYPIHVYGSANASLKNYRIEGNILYSTDGKQHTLLVGGGSPVANAFVDRNLFYSMNLQMGYGSTQNQSGEASENLFGPGSLNLGKFSSLNTQKNRTYVKTPSLNTEVYIRPNAYDLSRANVAVFRFGTKDATVEVDLSGFLHPGEAYRFMNPKNLWGAPVVSGSYTGGLIALPVTGEFASFVLFKQSEGTTSQSDPPSAPSSPWKLNAAAQPNAVDLSWAANSEEDLLGYNVYSALQPGGPYTRVNSAPVADTHLRVDNLANNCLYYFYVTALGRDRDESSASNAQCVMPAAPLSGFALAPIAPLAAGVGAAAIATADLDKDGWIDLIVACQWQNRVALYRGNGNGAFGPPIYYPTAVYPNDLAIADFNGDGHTDLAVSGLGGSISVMFGNGDGTFQKRRDYAAGLIAFAVVAGDFNGDGHTDLATVDTLQNCATVFLNNGAGAFPTKRSFAAGSMPSSLKAADLNGDDDLDLLVTNYSGSTLSVLLGKGDGSFQGKKDYAVGASPRGLCVTDLNGDGNPDVALANNLAQGGSLTVLIGDGRGAFFGKQTYRAGRGASAVTASDLDGDGAMDLAITNSNDNTLQVFHGNPDGTLGSKVEYRTGVFPLAIVAVDLKGNQASDLIVANYLGGTLNTWLHF